MPHNICLHLDIHERLAHVLSQCTMQFFSSIPAACGITSVSVLKNVYSQVHVANFVVSLRSYHLGKTSGAGKSSKEA